MFMNDNSKAMIPVNLCDISQMRLHSRGFSPSFGGAGRLETKIGKRQKLLLECNQNNSIAL